MTETGSSSPQTKPFDSFELPDDVLESLKAMGITETTPIQGKVLDPVLAGKDVVGKAETGTGKTTLAKIIATLLVALVLVFRPQGLFGKKPA